MDPIDPVLVLLATLLLPSPAIRFPQFWMSSLHQVSKAPVQRAARRTSHPCFGPWRCVRLLGTGRWTEVYQAAAVSQFHESADYVLKTLRPEGRDDPLARGMLQQQAYLGAQISHPHLESILAAHVDGPPYYVVTALMHGATLMATLQQAERLSTPHSLWLARQCAEGLQTLHHHAWIHGDIKPANVFVSSSGHATLIDLGLARRIGHHPDGAPPVMSGTPAYAAPETGSTSIPAGAYSDVYSLGVTLFEMLTGRLPYIADKPGDLLRAHLEQSFPEPRRFAPWLPRRVSRLLARMLAKQPLRRPCVGELIDWLVDLEIDVLEERLIEA